MTTISAPAELAAWRGFQGGPWRDRVDVAGFVRANVRPYEGDAGFLAGPTRRTTERVGPADRDVRRRSASAASTTSTPHTPASITAHAPGLHRPGPRAHRRPADRRAAAPRDHAERRPADGRERAARPTATSSTRLSRRSSPSTARPTTTASSTRTRRRSSPPAGPASSPACRTRTAGAGSSATTAGCALYGVDRADRREARATRRRWTARRSTADVIRDREELAEQIRALDELKEMAASYGYDITGPARDRAGRPCSGCTSPTSPRPRSRTARRCRSGRTSTFLDIYLERDLAEGRAHRAAAPRSSSTTSSSSCGSSGSCARPSTTSCSPATRPGSPRRSAAWAATAAPLVTRTSASATCRPSTTWARRRSPT